MQPCWTWVGIVMPSEVHTLSSQSVRPRSLNLTVAGFELGSVAAAGVASSHDAASSVSALISRSALPFGASTLNTETGGSLGWAASIVAALC